MAFMESTIMYNLGSTIITTTITLAATQLTYTLFHFSKTSFLPTVQKSIFFFILVPSSSFHFCHYVFKAHSEGEKGSVLNPKGFKLP